MKNAPRTEVGGAAVGGGANGSAAAHFAGTDNWRQLRALAALLASPMPRERTPCIDRDGSECKRGIYYLTERDRARVNRWLRLRAERGAR